MWGFYYRNTVDYIMLLLKSDTRTQLILIRRGVFYYRNEVDYIMLLLKSHQAAYNLLTSVILLKIYVLFKIYFLILY